MFDWIPFEQTSNHLFHSLDPINRAFLPKAKENTVPCKTDIIDQDNRYLLRIDLPGVKKENIHIEMKGDDCLTISAQCGAEAPMDSSHYIRRERYSGLMCRSFDVSTVDVRGIKAKYENGVLELTLPKKQASVSSNRRIEIH